MNRQYQRGKFGTLNADLPPMNSRFHRFEERNPQYLGNGKRKLTKSLGGYAPGIFPKNAREMLMNKIDLELMNYGPNCTLCQWQRKAENLNKNFLDYVKTVVFEDNEIRFLNFLYSK